MALNLTGLQDILWLRMRGASTCSFKSPILIVIMSLEKSETPETEKNLCSVITHQSIRRSLIFRAPLALALIPDFSERRSRSRSLKNFRAALPLALARNPSAALPSAL